VRRRSRSRQCALLLALSAGACTTARETQLVRDAAARLAGSPELAGGRVGIVVADGGTGVVLASRAAASGFATASNMKLLTAAVALHTLGPDHVAATRLLARGDVVDGVLNGDLVLRGEGDPAFGVPSASGSPLAEFVEAVRAMGIRRVAGRVVGDGSWLGRESLGLGWQWDYLDEDYAAPFGGLCCAGNVLTLRVRAGDGGPTVIQEPAVAAPVRLSVQLADAGAPTSLRARRALGAAEIDVSGTLARDAAEQVLRVAVPDPAAFAAAALAAALRAAGIDVAGAAAAPAGRDAEGAPEVLVATHDSPTVAALLRPILTDSDNLCAEQLWRMAARVASGDGGTASAECHARRVLAELGVDPAGMVLADGSGLSRRNLVQPGQIAALLVAMQRSAHRAAFVESLPVAGRSGTLKRRMLEGPACGRVAAKTGFISRVVCLSGYVPRRAPGAAPLAFVAMLNDFTCSDAAAKAAVDAFAQELAAAAGW
jgi:D-alanyl-D-alanine carboxypeptidase/D-alanyl-D-alanine-endopeptidase (penicillin-binding protein 4)